MIRKKVNYQTEEVKRPTLKDWYTLEELVRLEFSDADFLWNDYLPKGALSILVGSGAAGKSSLMKNLMFAIAEGRGEYLGVKLNASHGKAVFVSTEEGERIFIKSIAKNPSTGKVELLKKLFVTHAKHKGSLGKILKENDVDLVVIDPLGNFLTADGNSQAQVRKVLEDFVTLARERDIAVVGIHHLTKAGRKKRTTPDQILGSTAFVNVARSVVALDAMDNGQRALHVLKTNVADDSICNEELILDFNKVNLTFDATEKRKKAFNVAEEQKAKLEDDIAVFAYTLHESEGVKYADMPDIIEQEFGVKMGKTKINDLARDYEESQAS